MDRRRQILDALWRAHDGIRGVRGMQTGDAQDGVPDGIPERIAGIGAVLMDPPEDLTPARARALGEALQDCARALREPPAPKQGRPTKDHEALLVLRAQDAGISVAELVLDAEAHHRPIDGVDWDDPGDPAGKLHARWEKMLARAKK